MLTPADGMSAAVEKRDFGTSWYGSSVIKLPQPRIHAEGGNEGLWPIATWPQKFMSAIPRKRTNPNRRD
jgi:hypothetical protein